MRRCVPATAPEKFRDAFESRILPRLAEFQPELVIISAGFDAHYRDPLANINLEEADFAWATQKIMDVADRHAGGRVVSCSKAATICRRSATRWPRMSTR